MRQARGVLPRKNDWVISRPDAEGMFIFVSLRADIDRAGVLAWLGRVDALIQDLRAQVNKSKERLATVATGFGPSFFTVNGQPRFVGTLAPAGFGAPLPTVPSGMQAPGDVMFYVMSVSEAVAVRFLTGLWATRPDVIGIQLERGYQRSDGTEAFGFRDGLRNVPHEDRTEVALVDIDRLPEEPDWADKGSYLAYMRIVQDLDRFATLSNPEQVIGRARDGRRLDLPEGTDPHDEPEFTGTEPPTSCHIRKAGPRGAVRDRTRIFRRGLPFVEAGPDGLRFGLQFASFQGSLDQFKVVFNRWMMNPTFPQPAPERADDLISQGLITIERWGFYFVPPDTDEPVGTVIFKAPPVPKKPKTGRVAVRKKVVDESGQEAMADLGGFRFRVVAAATGQPVGGEFETDSAGHARSDEIPTDADYTLEELAPPSPFPPLPPIPFRLESKRKVLRVENHVPAGSGGYNP